MIGTILNAAAILLGATVGLALKWEPSVASQHTWKLLIGGFAVYAGLSAIWQSLPGPFLAGLKSLGIVMAALMLGNFTGSLLRLQKSLNRLGQYAAQRVRATSPADARVDDTFAACTILFCVSPIAVIGALQDGLSGDWKTLAAKSAMDGLACLDEIVRRFPTIKVVMLSASTSPELIAAALRRGASAYLAKSVDPSDLPSTLRQVLEGNVWRENLPSGEEEPSSAKALGLTEREGAILQALARGLSNDEIAKELWVTQQTVKFHLTNIYRKLGAKNRTQATRIAQQHGLVDSPLFGDDE